MSALRTTLTVRCHAVTAAEGYTKLRVWGLIQFRRVVYIDADALVMEDLDEVNSAMFICGVSPVGR